MGTPDGHEVAARRLVERVQRRVALNEAVGIMQAWRDCGQQEARDDLRVEHGVAGQQVEADRLIAVVNADARSRADPDAGWD
ncbi:hypothetical protein [Amycolatopsis magusensis]|uniref:ANTAR domain-containing protein n=1 Tax=Amycolatopsis magusensis TaxID=882444 RepID=A0ABS4Q1P5_9PSEU|nr:hypothetical protein [Amycolatopsis magusensis]MBP2185597.1 hypothetical protein [Amycolatopsis magusensis]MDI5980688.1 hypothetical protein [Amycolatopsis magusensis]